MKKCDDIFGTVKAHISPRITFTIKAHDKPESQIELHSQSKQMNIRLYMTFINKKERICTERLKRDAEQQSSNL